MRSAPAGERILQCSYILCEKMLRSSCGYLRVNPKPKTGRAVMHGDDL